MGFADVEGLAQLRTLLARVPSDPGMKPWVSARDEVVSRFQPVFTRAGIEDLSAEGFRDFLLFRNNKHWSGLHRLLPAITEDMGKLREALLELTDEAVPISKRLDRLIPNGRARVRKLGKAVLTPILLITHPDRYGVWNGTSEAGMRKLKCWPLGTRGESVGTTYEGVNEILLGLTKELETDLWTLDALWWRLLKPEAGIEENETHQAELAVAGSGDQRFGMERHLHQFLVENWERTDLGKDWVLCEEGGDIEGYGSERQTDVGAIDLLAKHKSQPRWLVVELKRGQTSDATVGQILRYMGWVKEQLAGPKQAVEGLVIALDADERMRYALMQVPAVQFRRYEVAFKLVAPSDPARRLNPAPLSEGADR